MNPLTFLLHGLTLLFVGLKLTGNIDWSWWLATLPSWGPLALWAAITIVGFALQKAAWALMTEDERKRHKAAEAIERYVDALKRQG